MNRKHNSSINVLVVDDSALVRQTMAMLLDGDPRFKVTVAADPMIAMRKIVASVPDVILLDLEMPRMDGLTFMKKLKDQIHIPIVICSSLAEGGSDIAVRAMEQGAIEVISKPRLAVRGFLEESRVVIADALLGAARSRRIERIPVPSPPSARLTADEILPPSKSCLRTTTDQVIAVGASTGGTEALRFLLAAMPFDCPGIVVVQHMPEVFTTAFAKRLDSLCAIDVKEAASGDRVSPGRALIAPGNRHLLLQRSGAHYFVEVVDGALVSRHRPSVDVLFRSVAQAAGTNAIGVIMTGMGSDGAAGMLEMKLAGAHNIAQDEASCVVFGMPKEAIESGATHQVVPLQSIPRTILMHRSRAATLTRA